MKALLALEDGRIFPCRSFTGPGETSGEAVFNTSMTGYQEVLTDPSYKGQMVTMTYPLIGNYGINPEDIESASIHVAAFVKYSSFFSDSFFKNSARIIFPPCEIGFLGRNLLCRILEFKKAFPPGC